MYLLNLVLAVPGIWAIAWGWRQMGLTAPPEREMRDTELGYRVTGPAEKLALAHRQGLMAMVFGAALIIGPMIAGLAG